MIKYNDTSMPTGMQCGGYTNGQPPAFSCSPEFRTAGCDGYTCNFAATPPKCKEDPEGAAPTLEACQAGTQQSPPCKVAALTKCNTDTKQCEPCTAGSTDPGCKYTKDACDAICAAPHSKCNYETKKCEPCDFGVDPKCTRTSGSCAAPGVCTDNTFGLCNVTTGM